MFFILARTLQPLARNNYTGSGGLNKGANLRMQENPSWLNGSAASSMAGRRSSFKPRTNLGEITLKARSAWSSETVLETRFPASKRLALQCRCSDNNVKARSHFASCGR